MDKVINLPENMMASSGEVQFIAEKKPRSFLFSALAALLFIGVVYGAVLAGSMSGEASQSLEQLTGQFLLQKQGEAFLPALLSSLLSGGVFVLLLFLCGFSGVGQPFSLFLIFFRGIGLGTSMGYFYLSLGLQGVFTSLALIVPAGVVSSYAILLAGRESLKLSNRIFKAVASRDFVMPEGILKTYSLKFLILMLLILFSALIHAVCSLAFGLWANS